MVYKRSEYGHQFKVSSLIKNVPVYKEHLSYRNLRREREFSHTPLSWDGEIIESSESEEKLEEDINLPISELVISEEEEDAGEENKKSEDEAAESDDEVARQKKEAKEKDSEKQEVEENKCEVVVVKQNEALRKSAKQKLNKYVSMKNKNEPTPSKEVSDKKVCKY